MAIRLLPRSHNLDDSIIAESISNTKPASIHNSQPFIWMRLRLRNRWMFASQSRVPDETVSVTFSSNKVACRNRRRCCSDPILPLLPFSLSTVCSLARFVFPSPQFSRSVGRSPIHLQMRSALDNIGWEGGKRTVGRDIMRY